MNSPIAKMAKRSKTAIIAFKIYDNWRIKRAATRGVAETLHGSTHSHKALADSLDYINVQYADYLRYGDLTPEKLQGKRIFELGFGDNIGVALKFLAVGAARAVCLDKFYSKRNAEQERKIYLALRETLSYEQQRRFDNAIDLTGGIDLNPEKLKCIYGSNVEDTTELPEAEPFDFTISRGAIQDIYDPDPAFEAMDRLLAPGGVALHKIDLSDQGMFRDHSMNPLTFLTVSEPVYRLMALGSGKPNRKLKSYYQQKFAEMGYGAKILITCITGSGGKGDLHPHPETISKGVEYAQANLDYVNQIRPSLAAEFRNLPDEELLVEGIFVVARKRA
ncbi:MAG: class I SAM-dependent methyltransferase [Blastocatellia bacterium]